MTPMKSSRLKSVPRTENLSPENSMHDNHFKPLPYFMLAIKHDIAYQLAILGVLDMK